MRKVSTKLKRSQQTSKHKITRKQGAGIVDPFAFVVAEATTGYRTSCRTTGRKQSNQELPYFEDCEAGIKLIKGDCVEVMAKAPAECVDMVFADPPYFLSNNGVTCQAGRMVSVNKGKW